MKSSVSSSFSFSSTSGAMSSRRGPRLLMISMTLLLLFLSFFTSAGSSLDTYSSRKHLIQINNGQHFRKTDNNGRYSCGAFSQTSTSGSLCLQLQEMKGRLHRKNPRAGALPLPRSAATNHAPVVAGREIDPRYGVEKRLVPSGPNPLHN